MRKSIRWNVSDGPLQVTRTYFLQRIEPRLTLVLIFESKRLEKESYITNFIGEITQQLRGTRLFNCLKIAS